MLFLSYLVLAFPELSLLRSHFRPFTEVMRKGRGEVTRKSQHTVDQTEIAKEIDLGGGWSGQLVLLLLVLLINRN